MDEHESGGGISMVTWNLRAVIARMTDTSEDDWQEFQGPRSGSGLDYWYAGPGGAQAYVNLNQTLLHVSVEGGGFDETEPLDVDFDEIPGDHWVRGCVETSGPNPLSP